ncbi:hypothetical protein P171DRAFT_47206 [Karstenula rhodostoma CBS 690.94]|uniref:Uncharacterized protein n=1 Tax=Karstenula rhodostoma CBS 690.94 TaxID=1392251 RepID=A0A9P4PEU4_9PLEO|nr:hypothetical protein P171DRAFT_47206 [Karstenula rhodostoma CBS 690.94]
MLLGVWGCHDEAEGIRWQALGCQCKLPRKATRVVRDKPASQFGCGRHPRPLPKLRIVAVSRFRTPPQAPQTARSENHCIRAALSVVNAARLSAKRATAERTSGRPAQRWQWSNARYELGSSCCPDACSEASRQHAWSKLLDPRLHQAGTGRTTSFLIHSVALIPDVTPPYRSLQRLRRQHPTFPPTNASRTVHPGDQSARRAADR